MKASYAHLENVTSLANSFDSVEGSHDNHGFGKGKWETPTHQNWDAIGRAAEKKTAQRVLEIPQAKPKVPKVGGTDWVFQPDLSKIGSDPSTGSRERTGQPGLEDTKWDSNEDGAIDEHDTLWNVTGAGRMSSTTRGTYGTASGGSATISDPKSGLKSRSVVLQTGVEREAGVRAVAMNDDARHTAEAEAGFLMRGGFGAYAQLTNDDKKGVFATGGVGGKMGGYLSGEADTRTKKVTIGGADWQAGIGVRGNVFLGGKAGAGGTVGVGTDYIGAKGNVGAFIGAEAGGDIHGSVGPIAGKIGVSGMAGAGVGADGDISHQEGKFHMGGKVFAALGYGGSLSGDVTIDAKKLATVAKHLGSKFVDPQHRVANDVRAP